MKFEVKNMTEKFPSGGIDNILFLTDSYKVTHHQQYPPGTTKVYSYFESRGGKFQETVFFGLQYILKRWLVGPRITKGMVEEASEVYEKHFGRDVFNKDGWMYIVNKHGGKLPLLVKAVPEGTVVPVKNVLFTVENTDPECYWLTNYFETIFAQVWYPMTVATNSREQKKILAKYLEETSDSTAGLPFKLHDFGYRGASSVESAGIGGAAHLVNFMGTDTVAALLTARKYYHCDMAGFSIPAAEHSTITTWGEQGEREAFKNMLDKFPDGLVAVVSDSYDIHKACSEFWGKNLKAQVEGREGKGTLVVRPDSGEPAKVVVEVLEILYDAFYDKKELGDENGANPNGLTKQGFKILPDYLRMIQGDGISYESLGNILEEMKSKGWAADNLAFGSGGALLQKLDRDTQKCAFKCSYAKVNGEGVNVFKNPKTDPGKQSKKGLLCLTKNENGEFKTIEQCPEPAEPDQYTPAAKKRRVDNSNDCDAGFSQSESPSRRETGTLCLPKFPLRKGKRKKGKEPPTIPAISDSDLLIPVFMNGELLKDYKFEEIRELAKIAKDY